MSRTRRFGWEGWRGEIPALRGHLENTARGNPERHDPGEFDGDFAYEAQIAPWSDDEFKANAELCVALMGEIERIKTLRHMPIDEWPDADVERIARLLMSANL